MFGILEGVVDVATDLVGATVEVGTLGLVSSKNAKKLADAGWSVYKISQSLGVSEDDVVKLLK